MCLVFVYVGIKFSRDGDMWEFYGFSDREAWGPIIENHLIYVWTSLFKKSRQLAFAFRIFFLSPYLTQIAREFLKNAI